MRNPKLAPRINLIVILSFHLMLIAGIYITGIKPAYLLVLFITWLIGGFGITMGYHRYFSHKSFKTGRVFQFILCLIASSTLQGGVLFWVAVHRQHHRYADTANDLHSPKLHGWFWAHIGWLISTHLHPIDFGLAKEWLKYPEIRWLDKYHYLIVVLYALLLIIIGEVWQYFYPLTTLTPFALLVWGFFARTVLMWHFTWSINSLMHMIGKQRYLLKNTSRNNWWLALLTLGEGWHNNHHRYPTSARNGFYWFEIDFTFYLIKLLSWLKITRHVVLVPPAILEEGRKRHRLPRSK